MFDRHSPCSRKSLIGTVFASNPLVSALDASALQLKGDRVIVNLGVRPQAVVEEIHLFGPVLSIVRNPSAVLGRIGLYPEVHVSPLSPLTCSRAGEMTFDFSRWDKVFVSIEDQMSGWLYSLEFCDVFGDTLHKICLTPESDFGAFRDWVELNQSAQPGPRGFGHRYTAGSGALASLPGEVISLQPLAIRSFVDHLVQGGLSSRVVVGNSGVVLASDLQPRVIQENGNWIFADGSRCGLHLEVGCLTDAFLHRGQDSTKSAWTINACEQEGGLVCSFGPSGEDRAAWDAMLTAFATKYHVTNSNP